MNKNTMKKIKELTVTASYTVTYYNVEVPDNVCEEMLNNETFTDDDINNQNAMEWLMNNVKEHEAHDWKYNVDDFEVEE